MHYIDKKLHNIDIFHPAEQIFPLGELFFRRRLLPLPGNPDATQAAPAALSGRKQPAVALPDERRPPAGGCWG
jgi:hypothetical protein